MRHLRFWLNFSVLIVPLILLSIGSIRLVQREWRFLSGNTRIAEIASIEATRALGREVHIGSIRFSGNLLGLSALNHVELRDVAVAQGTRLKDGSILRADKVVIWYNFRQIFLTKDKRIPLVNEVLVVGPQGRLARDAQGHWNFASFITGKAPPQRPFLDKLTVRNGTLFYADASFPHPAGVPKHPFATRVDAMTGVGLIRPDKSLLFTFSGMGEPSIARDIHLTGMVDPATLRIDAHLTASQVALPVLSQRLLRPDRARITSGVADLQLSALYLPEGHPPRRHFQFQALDARGTAQLANVSANLPKLGLPLARVSGTTTFTTHFLVADLKGQAAETDLSLKGSLFGLPRLFGQTGRAAEAIRPTLALQATAPNADVTRIIRSLNLARRLPGLGSGTRLQIQQASGHGSLNFQYAGVLDNPTATLQARLDTLRSGNYQLGQVDLNALYTARTFHADVHTHYAHGDLAVRAQIAADRTHAFRVEAHGRNTQLDALGLALHRPLHGTGDLDLVAQGQRGSLPQVRGQAQVYNLEFNNQTINSVYAKVQMRGHQLYVENLRLDDPKGFALARGLVDLKAHTLNLNVAADDLDFTAFTSALPKSARPNLGQQPLQFAGIGYVRGSLTGPVNMPLFRGSMTAFGIQMNQVALDMAEADLDVSRDAFVFHQGTMRRYPGLARFSGVITDPFGQEAGISLTANAENLDIADLLHTVGVKTDQMQIAGALSADLRVNGRLAEPRVVADNIHLRDAVLDDLPLEAANATAVYGPDGAQLQQARMQIAGGSVKASGSITRDGELSFDFKGSGLQLGTLGETLAPNSTTRLAGTLTVQGKVQGTAKDPTVHLTVATQGLAANAVSLGELNGSFTYQHKQLLAEGVTLGDPAHAATTGGSIAITRLTYNSQDKAVSGSAQVQDFAVQKLRELAVSLTNAQTEAGQKTLSALGQITGPIAGTLSATVALDGTVDKPRVDVDWQAHGIQVTNHVITSLVGSARLTEAGVVIPSPAMPTQVAHLESPDANIDAQADVQFDGQLTGSLSAYNVNLTFLQNWIQEDIARQIKGTGDLFVVASGKTSSPILDISISLRDLSYRDQTLNRLEITHATIAEGSITADSIQLTKQDMIQGTAVTYHGMARGTIGFTWKPPFIPPDAKLDIQADIPRQNLQLLSAFAPGLAAASTGEIGISAHVAGTRTDPNVTGTLTLNALKLRLRSFATGLGDVNAQLAFKGDQLVVQQFTAHSQLYNIHTGDPVPGPAGGQLTLTGSLPLVRAPGTPQTEGEGLRLQTVPGAPIQFAENPLPGVTSGSAHGLAALDLRVTRSLFTPTIAGDITLSNAQMTLPRDFGGFQGGGTPLPINPRFNLRVNLGSNVQLTNPQLNAHTSGGILLTGDLADPSIQGTLNINSGRLTLPTARFTIQPPGSLRLLYPAYDNAGLPTLGVNVDVRAQTNMMATSVAGIRRNYTITVTARGPVSGTVTDPATGQPRLTLSFQSDPPDLALNQQDLTQQLAGVLGNSQQSLTAALSNVFAGSVLPGLLDRPAEQLGFEQFSLSYDPIQHLNLTVSRRLLTINRHLGLYVQYIRSLDANTELYDLKVSLRFRSRYQLSYDLDEQNTQQLLLEGVWQF
jgi:hypothetical protein